MKQKENIENNTPFLDGLPKKNNFSVPKNYFESLPEVISSKTLDNKSLVFNFDKLSYRILVPICTLLVVFSALYLWDNNQGNEALTSDQISTFLIQEKYDEIDEDLIIESYAELLAENESSEKNDEAYIDYLIDNDIELETLIEAY